jgi:hypothetical protein
MSALAGAAATLDMRWVLLALLAILNLWSIGLVWLANARRREKMLWTAVVMLCPIIGSLFWFVLGPNTREAARAD